MFLHPLVPLKGGFLWETIEIVVCCDVLPSSGAAERVRSMTRETLRFLAVTCLGFMTSCDWRSAEPARAAPSLPVASAGGPLGAATATSPAEDAGEKHGVRLPGMECVVNQFGIRRKALVTAKGVRCIDRVPAGHPVGQALRFFHPYFVFEVWPPEGAPQFYRLGLTPRKDSIIGWCPAAATAPWDTRVGARYCRAPGLRVPPLLVYRDQASAAELARCGTTTTEPIARASYEGKPTFMPWPIAETAQVTAENGQVHELLRVLFLAEVKEGGDLANTPTGEGVPKPYSPEEAKGIRAGVRMLDLVFVLDVTGSMQPYIDAVKRTILDISKKIQDFEFQPDVAMGLVAYRDRDPESKFVTQPFDLERNRDKLLQKLSSLRASAGGDYTESVYDGVYDALNGMSWRGERLSARVIVLVGDCPAHEPGDPQNPRQISQDVLVDLCTSQQKNVRIFALAVGGRGGNPAYDLRWRQFESLSRRTGGTCNPIEDANRVVDMVRSVLEGETALVHQRSVVVEELARGKRPEEIVAEKRMEIREVTEVMEFLAGAGVDARRFGPLVPTFATGWILADVKGIPVVEKEVYVARAELDILLSELNSLCVHLSPDLARRALLEGLRGRTSDPLSFFRADRPEPMDVFLIAMGVPCSQGILKLTRSEIEHMPEERRAILRERIARNVIPGLVNARNDDRYYCFLDDLEFGWVKESLFP